MSRDLPELPTEADLATRHEVGRQRPVGTRRHDRERHRQVSRRLVHAHAAGGKSEDVGVAHAELDALLEHAEHHREAARIDALGRPAWLGDAVPAHERLDLDEQRPAALHGRHDDGPRHSRLPVGEQQRAALGNADEPGIAHLEQPELAARAEPVLDGAHEPQRVMAVSLEGQDRVDDVLEGARTGERAVLGHVTDEDDRDAPLLRDAHEAMRAPSDLGHRPRGRRDRGVLDRLDRVDDDEVGGDLVELGDDGVEVGLRRQPEPVGEGAEALRPQPDLLARLLGRHVQGTAGPRRRHLGEQGRLPDAGLAADERDRARHQAAAEDAVELADGGRAGDVLGGVDLPDRHRDGDPARRPPVRRSSGCPRHRTTGSAPPTSGAARRSRCSGGRSASGPCAHHAEGV